MIDASETSLSLYWQWHPLQGPGYQFWSGIASDLGEITLVTGLAGLYWHRTCHVGRCWRPAKHEVVGTPYKVCRKHHPAVPDRVTAEHIVDARDHVRRERAHKEESP